MPARPGPVRGVLDVHAMGRNTLVTLSSAGAVDELSADGELSWHAETGFGALFEFSEHQPDLQSLLAEP